MKKRRITEIQIIRAIAASAIFFSHAFPQYGYVGGWGVSIFLVLSGFVMCYGYFDRELRIKSVKDSLLFACGRIKKMYILHLLLLAYAVTGMSLASLAAAGTVDLPMKTLGLNILLLKTWVPQRSIFYSFKGNSWFLCDIFFIYLLFPVILHVIRKYRNSIQAVAAIAFTYAAMVGAAVVCGQINVPATISDDLYFWFTYICPFFRLGDFIIGCNMGYLFLRVSQDSSNAQGESTAATLGYTAAELAAVLLLVISFKHRYNQIQFFHVLWLRSTLLWLPSSALLIFLFSNGRGLLSASLSKSRILRLIGNLSSFTYLIHPYCIELVKSMPQDSSFQKGFAMLVAFLITHMAAYCYSQLLDRSLA